MKLADIRNETVKHKNMRDAYYKILNFIKSDRCYNGIVEILYGLRRTGKTTIMEQLVMNNSNDISFLFIQADKNDTMDDIYNRLDKAIEDNVKCVLIDEITFVSDFIDNSAALADIYAKEGLRIILAGTDSLSFIFAEKGSLYDRTEHISTTYVPFEEHCRVLNTTNIDDYISFGGLMKKDENAQNPKDKRVVYDYSSAKTYLDEAVTQNISHSIEKLSHFANNTKLMKVTKEEMRSVIEKVVEKYSGIINQDVVNNQLNKVIVSAPVNQERLRELEEQSVIKNLIANKANILHEFVQTINADTNIEHKFDDDMILSLENELIGLGFLSVTNKQELLISDEFGYRNEPLAKEYYIIQPAIKYHHLVKALDFIDEKEYYQKLSESGRNYFKNRIENQIKGDMTEQIIVYETSKALSTERYSVYKVCFRNATAPNKDLGEYDMLVYDKQQNCCWGFEIKHSSQTNPAQYKNLTNEKFKDAVNYMYGNIERLCVLYNGESFLNENDILYLNLSDFVKAISDKKDVQLALFSLNKNLSQRNVEEENKDLDKTNSTNNNNSLK